ncbi:MAG TPA: peptide chain release factor N(5)-glutamine methyltransferase [Pirellulaceae bacterium]|nr:peptide chain release factor N(5)-glutamine methyltransferase [Pirellulaceae bacterium]
MSQDEPWTIGRLLKWTTDRFKQSGALNPRLDAEVLLAEARGCERIQLYTAFDETPGEDVLKPFRQFVRRRIAGEPVAYLVGRREFYSMSFEVTPDVLIPRPETELVVVELLDGAKALNVSGRPLRIADVGTGSGVIAVCAAKQIPNCEVVAIDVSAASLAVAQRNVELHGVGDRVKLLESDMLDDVLRNPLFDFVVSNPPYISAPEYRELAVDVRGYEPKLALLGGETGTELIETLIHQAATHLRVGGSLILEISPMVEDRVRQLIDAAEAFEPPRTVADLSGLARVITARRIALDHFPS